MANDFAIRQTMKNVTVENLNMGFWGIKPLDGCGTTMCLAGHAVVAFGHELKWEPEYKHVLDEDTYMMVRTDEIEKYSAFYTTDGRPVDNLAQEILGLDDEEAGALFYSDPETPDELWDRITYVTGVEQEPAAA